MEVIGVQPPPTPPPPTPPHPPTHTHTQPTLRSVNFCRHALIAFFVPLFCSCDFSKHPRHEVLALMKRCRFSHFLLNKGADRSTLHARVHFAHSVSCWLKPELSGATRKFTKNAFLFKLKWHNNSDKVSLSGQIVLHLFAAAKQWHIAGGCAPLRCTAHSSPACPGV